jgi:hypothetical protein
LNCAATHFQALCCTRCEERSTREFLLDVAYAHAEPQAAITQGINLSRLLRNNHGLPHGQHEYAGNKFYA